MKGGMLGLFVLANLCGACGADTSAQFGPPPSLCLTALDVGQGDALLLSFPYGRHWLVDGGGSVGGGLDVGNKKLLPALRRLGVVHLDKVFMTHAHSDHFEGLFAVFESIEVDEFWLPSRFNLKPRTRALVGRALQKGVRVLEAGHGARPTPRVGAVKTQLLYPFPDWKKALVASGSEANDSSIVLRLALGEVSFLLTGDIEAAAEDVLVARGLVERSTVLKIPHHASKSSSTPAFVSAVDPLLAVAGIGRNNRFGFPHASVSRRYLSRGVPMLWTARHGTVRLCTDGFSLRLEQLHEKGPPTLYRSWDPSSIAVWRDRGNRTTASSFGEAQGSCSSSVIERAASEPRRRKISRRSSATVNASKSKSKKEVRHAATERSRSSLDERQWQRSRSQRKRLRAPWK
jgi:competence protein ComEC